MENNKAFAATRPPTKHKRRFCKVEGCERIVKSQGLCQRHGAVSVISYGWPGTFSTWMRFSCSDIYKNCRNRAPVRSPAVQNKHKETLMECVKHISEALLCQERTLRFHYLSPLNQRGVFRAFQIHRFSASSYLRAQRKFKRGLQAQRLKLFRLCLTRHLPQHLAVVSRRTVKRFLQASHGILKPVRWCLL